MPNFLEVFEQLQSAVQLAVLAASVLVIAAGVPIGIWFFATRSPTARLIAARVFSWAGILVLSIALVIFDRTADTNDIGFGFLFFWSLVAAAAIYETLRLMAVKPRKTARTWLGLLWLAAILVGGYKLFDLAASALVLLFVVALFDIGGWVGGKTLARFKPFDYKIFKKTSPNKTLGGLLVSFVLGGVAWLWVFGGGMLFGEPAASINLTGYLGLAAFAVLGDWFESKLKRLANVKDAGAIIPGFGGVLDRFDSIIWVGVGSLLINYF